MSLSTYYMRQAATKSALQAARNLHIQEILAVRTAPVSLWLVLQALRRNSASPFTRTGLRYALNRSREDVLKDGNRLGAADVRARGDALFQKIMGRHGDRAITVISQLAKTDKRGARSLLAMSAVAVVSALSETKRELHLTPEQTLGVLISEAAFMDNTDPALLNRVRNWVFRPPIWSRIAQRFSNFFEQNRRPVSA